MNDVIRGAIAGLTATAPMTVLMELWHRQLPAHERYPLPPRQITERVLARAGAPEESERAGATTAATYVGHFGYGAAAGAAYGWAASRVPGSPVAKGIIFGLAVWAGSYLGWLPAAGVLSPATRHPRRRNALMIAAHGVWGAATGVLTDSLSGESGMKRPKRRIEPAHAPRMGNAPRSGIDSSCRSAPECVPGGN